MRPLSILAAAAVLMVSAAQAQTPAQPPASSASPPPTGAAPAQRGGPTMGPGPGMGRGGPTDMPAGGMMTPEERQAHMARMHGFTTRRECEAYVAEHHRLMADRAQQRGVTPPAGPRRNPCVGLK